MSNFVVRTTRGDTHYVKLGKFASQALTSNESESITISNLTTVLSKRLQINAEYLNIFLDEQDDEKSDATYVTLDIEQPKTQLQQMDMYKIVYGSAFLASGGGGALDIGLSFANQIKGTSTLISPKILPVVDKNKKKIGCITPIEIGSPMDIQNASAEAKYEHTAPVNAAKFAQKYWSKMVDPKEQMEIGGFYAAEIGAINTIVPFYVAQELNLPVIDADGVGRSVPYIWLTLPETNGISITPACLAQQSSKTDDTGYPIYWSDSKMTAHQLNDNITSVLQNVGGFGGMCLWPIREPTNKAFWGVVNLRSIDLTVCLGNVFLNKPPSERLKEAARIMKTRNIKVYDLFHGELIYYGSEHSPTWMGQVDITYMKFKNKTTNEEFATFGLNENLIAINLKTKQYHVIGPDLASLLDWNYSPLDATTIKQYVGNGKIFHVVGIQAWPNLRTDKMVSAFLENIQQLIKAANAIYKVVLPDVKQYIPVEQLNQNPI
eukprot:238560_1